MSPSPERCTCLASNFDELIERAQRHGFGMRWHGQPQQLAAVLTSMPLPPEYTEGIMTEHGSAN